MRTLICADSRRRLRVLSVVPAAADVSPRTLSLLSGLRCRRFREGVHPRRTTSGRFMLDTPERQGCYLPGFTIGFVEFFR